MMFTPVPSSLAGQAIKHIDGVNQHGAAASYDAPQLQPVLRTERLQCGVFLFEFGFSWGTR